MSLFGQKGREYRYEQVHDEALTMRSLALTMRSLGLTGAAVLAGPPSPARLYGCARREMTCDPVSSPTPWS